MSAESVALRLIHATEQRRKAWFSRLLRCSASIIYCIKRKIAIVSIREVESSLPSDISSSRIKSSSKSPVSKSGSSLSKIGIRSLGFPSQDGTQCCGETGGFGGGEKGGGTDAAFCCCSRADASEAGRGCVPDGCRSGGPIGLRWYCPFGVGE